MHLFIVWIKGVVGSWDETRFYGIVGGREYQKHDYPLEPNMLWALVGKSKFWIQDTLNSVMCQKHKHEKLCVFQDINFYYIIDCTKDLQNQYTIHNL